MGNNDGTSAQDAAEGTGSAGTGSAGTGSAGTPAVIDKEVIVLGGGFAGVAAAQRLARENVEVLLIDRNNYHQFKPLNYQVATAQLGTSEVAHPLREAFRKHDSVQVAVAEVARLDPAGRSVTLADGTVCRARILVVATGVDAHFFGTPGAEEHTYPMYTLADAKRLSNRLIDGLDRLDRPAGGHKPMNVVIVGGGPTGVELAGAIAENLRTVVAATYSNVDAGKVTVHLVDRGHSLLKPFSDASHHYARTELEQLGVRLHFGAGVASVDADGVDLDDGERIDAKIVVWAGGQKAPAIVSESGLPTGHGGCITVDADLTVPGFEGVYALGDIASIPDVQAPADGAPARPLPQLGSVAQQSGRHAAANILADLTGAARTPFRYLDKGIMAMIGRGAAVAEIGKRRRHMQGHAAFLAWLGVHVALLPGAWEKAAAVSSWVVDYGTSLRPRRVSVG